MFEYTRTAINKTIKDIKSLKHIFEIVTQAIYVSYLIAAILLEVGYMFANIILLVVSVGYLGFYLASYDKEKNEPRLAKHLFVAVKLTVNAITLGILFYGIYVAVTDVSPFTVLFSIAMAASWVTRALLELFAYCLESRVDLFMTSIEADVDNVLRPMHTVGNIIKRVTGKEPEPEKELSKHRKILDKMVMEAREQKRLSKLRDKESKKEQKQANAERRKQKRKEERQARLEKRRKNEK